MKKSIETIGIAILLGLLLLGIFIFKGLKTLSDKDRIVTVRGLAEMNLMATSVDITIGFSHSNDNLQTALTRTENHKNGVFEYLKTLGYNENDIKIGNLEVNDKQKYHEWQWRGGKEVEVKIDRYVISQKITIRSIDVIETDDKVAQMKLHLVSNNMTSNIEANYNFPELNSVKPQLIAESTKNARITGEQFANDSQSKLGKIKTATQGQITIVQPRRFYWEEEDPETPKEPYIQKLRVVSTIVFFLE
jgi:hypothetical protein